MKSRRNLLVLALTLALFLTTVAPMALSADGLTFANGGFEAVSQAGEEGNTYMWPDGWSVADNGNYGTSIAGTDIYLDTTTVRTGTYSLKIPGDKSKLKRVAYTATGLVPGNLYEVSAWVLITGNAASGRGMDIRVGKDNGGSYYTTNAANTCWFAGSPQDNAALYTTGGNWERVSFCYQQPESGSLASGGASYGEFTDTEACVALEIRTDSSYNADTNPITYYLDDVSIRPIADDFNSDFETVTTEKINNSTSVTWATGWGFGRSAAKPLMATDALISTEEAHSGTHSMKFNTAAKRVYTAIPKLTPGKAYRITAWAKITGDASVTTGPSIYVGADFFSSASTMWRTVTGSKSKDVWNKITTTFIVPSERDYGIVTLLAGTPGTNNTVYWDDISVTETSVTFTDSASQELSAVAVGEITATADFINSKAEEATATLIVAVYNVVGNVKTLVDIDIASGSAASKEAVTIPCTVTVDNANQIVKAILLDGTIGAMMPLIPATTIPAVTE